MLTFSLNLGKDGLAPLQHKPLFFGEMLCLASWRARLLLGLRLYGVFSLRVLESWVWIPERLTQPVDKKVPKLLRRLHLKKRKRTEQWTKTQRTGPPYQWWLIERTELRKSQGKGVAAGRGCRAWLQYSWFATLSLLNAFPNRWDALGLLASSAWLHFVGWEGTNITVYMNDSEVLDGPHD